ncbi:loco [Acrasis kona]|uniref:Loco n=1 Tax=Acrasis kona TaxID=1008807 RepID=A0AAW2YT56_9EUKA
MKHFSVYLSKSLNLEGFMFLHKLKTIKSPLTSPQEKVFAIKEIYYTYISMDGYNTINIDDKTRRLIESDIKQSNQLCTDELVVDFDIFVRAEKVVMKELKEDAFPRYIRSVEFAEFLHSKGEKYIKNISTNASFNASDEVVFRSSDFNSALLTDKDIEFILKINDNDKGWVPMRSTSGKFIGCYISRKLHHSGDMIKGLRLCKFVGNLPYSAEHVLRSITLFKTSKIYDRNQKVYEELDYVKTSRKGGIPFSLCYAYWEGVLNVPLVRRRKCIQVSTIVYDTERKAYIWFGKSTRTINKKLELALNANNKRKEAEELDYHWSYCIYETGEDECRYVHTVYADIKLNSLVDSLFKINMKRRAKGLHEGFSKVCDYCPSPGAACKGQAYLLRTLEDFKARYIPHYDSVKTWKVSSG